MRDPERIDTVLDAVRRAWAQNPDLRLGQLLFNAVSTSEGGGKVPAGPPLFYIEDDRLIEALES